MTDHSDTHRDKLHDAIQRDSRAAGDGAVLTGWTLVSEWIDSDGNPALSVGYDATSTTWKAKGMLHHVLDHNLFREYADDDDA